MIPQGSNIGKNNRSSSFSLLLSGEIETAEFLTTNIIYCKYVYVYGPDWKQVSGIQEGISSTAQRGHNSRQIVLNTPLEATFASTNPFKWPQIVLSCYGPDTFGNDVIRGYGATFLPSTPGRTTRKVPIFVPQASTTLKRIIGFFTGRYAEFVDSRIVSMAEGREVTRVSTKGMITLNLTTVLKDTKKLGYDLYPHSLARISEFPIPNFEEYANASSTEKTTAGSTANVGETNFQETSTIEPPSSPSRRIQTINEETSNDEEGGKTSTD